MKNSPTVVVSASIAHDYVMSFNGSFKDHILAEKAHVLSVSFLIESLKKQRGGVGGNIAYSLGLLGEPVALVGAVGEDFAEYRAALAELGVVDTQNVIDVEGEFTSTSFMNADLHGNQIAAFHPGAALKSRDIDITGVASAAEYGLVSAGDPEAMVLHTRQIAASGSKLVFDPAQQIPILSSENIEEGIELAHMVIGSDYEFAMMEKKTGLTVDDITKRAVITVVTYGEKGSEIRANGDRVEIPIAQTSDVVDPTGGGDAYRAGLLKGLLVGLDLPVVGRLAAQAATYAVEKHGTQEHSYDAEAFIGRFERSFPDFAGRVRAEDLQAVAAR